MMYISASFLDCLGGLCSTLSIETYENISMPVMIQVNIQGFKILKSAEIAIQPKTSVCHCQCQVATCDCPLTGRFVAAFAPGPPVGDRRGLPTVRPG